MFSLLTKIHICMFSNANAQCFTFEKKPAMDILKQLFHSNVNSLSPIT